MINKSLLKIVLYSQLCLLTMITLCSEHKHPANSNRGNIKTLRPPLPPHLSYPEAQVIHEAHSSPKEKLDPALFNAIINENLIDAQEAHRNGANPNALFLQRCTPLMLASSAGNSSFVEWLLSCKADPNMQDCNGDTALHSATVAPQQNFEIIRLLLQAKADPSIANIRNATPLLTAVKNTTLRKDNFLPTIIDLFIKAKADINARDNCGNTALHQAAYSKDGSLISLLIIIHNANPTLVNNRQLTPLDIIMNSSQEGWKHGELRQIIDTIMKYTHDQYH